MARKNAGFEDVELQPTSKMPRCGEITCPTDAAKDVSAREWPVRVPLFCRVIIMSCACECVQLMSACVCVHVCVRVCVCVI